MALVDSSAAGKFFEYTSGLQKRLKLSKLETLSLTNVYLNRNILFLMRLGRSFSTTL